MKYKTLYYNVEPIAKRLPDDCLKLIIQYAYDESKYNEWFQTIPHINQIIHQTLDHSTITQTITYGYYYQHLTCHAPKNVSVLTRFEYIYFSCRKRHNYNSIWDIIYIPMLKTEYNNTLFNNKRVYMLQLTKRVQKIE